MALKNDCDTGWIPFRCYHGEVAYEMTLAGQRRQLHREMPKEEKIQRKPSAFFCAANHWNEQMKKIKQ